MKHFSEWIYSCMQLLRFFFKHYFSGWIPRNITWSKGINMPFECILPNCFPSEISWFLFLSSWFYKLRFILLPHKCLPCLALTMLQTYWEDRNRREKCICNAFVLCQLLLRHRILRPQRKDSSLTGREVIFRVQGIQAVFSGRKSCPNLPWVPVCQGIIGKSNLYNVMICYPKEKRTRCHFQT